jgi:hypothetical protein
MLNEPNGIEMKSLYTLLRVLVAFLGFSVLLGVVWFVGSPGGQALLVPGVLMALSSLAVAFVPKRKLSNTGTQRILVALCVVGIGAGLVLVADDLGASHEIEWDVVVIRLVHIVALATMAIVSRRKPRLAQIHRT